MNFMKRFRRKKINDILDELDKKDLIKRYSLLSFGCLIIAFAFNVFFNRYGIVCFGVSGLSIVVSRLGVPNSLFILIANIILLILSYFLLGPKKTRNSIVGSLIFSRYLDIVSMIFVWFLF